MAYLCEYCDVDVRNELGKEQHNRMYRRYCAECNMCHESWHGHVRAFKHSYCWVGECAKGARPSFATNAEFLRHFNKYHAAKGGRVHDADEDEYGGYASDYAK